VEIRWFAKAPFLLLAATAQMSNPVLAEFSWPPASRSGSRAQYRFARAIVPDVSPADRKAALRAVGIAARLGGSLVRAIRIYRFMSEEELARRTGMPVARIRAEAEGKLSFTVDEVDALADALEVDADLLRD
jgi:hypothetical protein